MKKIFWLDDHPNISAISDIKLLSDSQITRRLLLENVIFAHDFSSGEEILSSKENDFGLYIVDGDFPTKIDSEQKLKVQNFLRELEKNEEHYQPLEGGFKNQYYNAFVEFCLRFLKEKIFVIHSMSQDAQELAFLLGWPFYTKLSNYQNKRDLLGKEFYHNDLTSRVPPKIFEVVYEFIKTNPRWQRDELIRNFFKLKVNQKLLDEWEFGDSRDLVVNYLIPYFSGKLS